MYKNEYIAIRLSEKEKEKLKKLAEENEMSMAEYIRRKIIKL